MFNSLTSSPFYNFFFEFGSASRQEFYKLIQKFIQKIIHLVHFMSNLRWKYSGTKFEIYFGIFIQFLDKLSDITTGNIIKLSLLHVFIFI